ncbi:helix-turn-helix domain-containing protein [Streptomyces microflavus]|uniref:helix-turn-helix domain-containing protein n=1 Tax=Streptomyces microflavus TaxID=1919 RepID=UPI0033DAC8D0
MASNGEQADATASGGADASPRRVSEIVGERLRRAREESGLRQSDLAEAAQRFGLKWGRSSVASLEAGTRNLSIEELALMPFVMASAGLVTTELIQDDDKVHLTELQFAWGYDFRRLFLAHAERMDLKHGEVVREDRSLSRFPEEILQKKETQRLADPLERISSARATLNQLFKADVGVRVWPKLGRLKAAQLYREPWTELDKKIADRIGATPSQVVLMAHALYGRSASEERDGRSEERASGRDRRTLQSVRGHVARDLVRELQKEWEGKVGVIERMKEEYGGASKSVQDAERLIDVIARRWKAHDADAEKFG